MKRWTSLPACTNGGELMAALVFDYGTTSVTNALHFTEFIIRWPDKTDDFGYQVRQGSILLKLLLV